MSYILYHRAKILKTNIQFSSVQSLSRVWLFVIPWTVAHQASLSFTVPWSLLKLMSIELTMPSKHLILCWPPSPFAFNLSQHQGLSQWVGSSHQVAKVLELQHQHQSFQWIFGVSTKHLKVTDKSSEFWLVNSEYFVRCFSLLGSEAEKNFLMSKEYS